MDQVGKKMEPAFMTNSPLYLMCMILGALGAAAMALWGKKLGFVDYPNYRSSHEIPTSKSGGIGIAAAFIAASLSIGIPVRFWLPALTITLLSFFEDRIDISPKLRLQIQFLITALFVAGMGPFSGNTLSHIFLLLSFLIFIVGTANFYNFMDGINGLAAITGIIGFGLMAVFAFYSKHNFPMATLSTGIAFSCLGFLPFNLPRARVFMGDVGSVLLGFLFSGMAVSLSDNLSDLIILTALLLPFYIDEVVSIYVRLKDRQSLFRPHRRHFYQLLANQGQVSHWKIALGYGIVQLIVGASLIAARLSGSGFAVTLTAALYIASTVFILHARKKLE